MSDEEITTCTPSITFWPASYPPAFSTSSSPAAGSTLASIPERTPVGADLVSPLKAGGVRPPPLDPLASLAPQDLGPETARHYAQLVREGAPALLADHCRLIERLASLALTVRELQQSNAQLRNLLDLAPLAVATPTPPRPAPSAAATDKTSYHHTAPGAAGE